MACYFQLFVFSFFLNFVQGSEILSSSCNTTQCPHNSDCILVSQYGVGPTKPTCKCTEGYTGRLCDIREGKLATLHHECRNGGRPMPCYSETFHCNVPKTCICPPGYTGNLCEYEICENSVGGFCWNGVCEETLGCLCFPGFYGNQCEYKACKRPNRLPIRCVHGNCVNGTCQCSPGYSGPTCEELSCNGFQCLNTAECVLGKCVCQKGYFGLNCEKKICPVSFRSCYRGDCSPTGMCVCYSGYVGEHCQYVRCGNTTCSIFSKCNQNALNGTSLCSCTSRYSGDVCDIGCDKDGLTQCTPRLKYDKGKGGSLTVQSIPWHWTFLISMFVVGAGAVLITMSVACRSSAQAKHERSSPQNTHSVLSPRKTLLEPTPHPLSVAITTSRGRLSVKAQRLSMIKSRKSTPKRGSALSHFAGHALSYRESTDSLPVQTPHTPTTIYSPAQSDTGLATLDMGFVTPDTPMRVSSSDELSADRETSEETSEFKVDP